MNDATRPATSATVSASAGTGKTWLLVTRLVRMLLDGAQPDAILAITFTRKAAEEMQTRLLERLYALAAADDAALTQQLAQLGVAATPDACTGARQLYERLLRSARPVRFYTFHAFCQDILRRFPLEADVPPGFELIEDTSLLEAEAWDALAAETTADPDGATAQALAVLMNACRGLANTRQAIAAFFAHRGDWWAYVAGAHDALAWADERLATLLDIQADDAPAAAFFHDLNIAALREFQELLNRHTTKTNLEHSARIEQALNEHRDCVDRFQLAASVFLTDKYQPRQRSSTKTQIEKMGADGDQRYLALHERLVTQVQDCIDRLRKQDTLRVNRAWYRAGARFLAHYQRLKAERRQLDFTDLEWKACALLNTSDNAHWVQYKLDQRIDHVLVDEFQDTNPTQWRLLLPLLEELAAGSDDRRRSAFLVGDTKQSIYRFRRADPRLFDGARTWLTQRLGAIETTLTASYRSSPAIIEFINTLFGGAPLNEWLPGFTPHATHRRELPGVVEVLPLIEADDARAATDAPAFRNPLQSPRALNEERRYYREGALIAARIRELVAGGVVLGAAGGARAAGYDDVLILVRNRTHLHAYEQALRDAGVPYLGQTRGMLMECVEVQDMTHLLRLLTAPYDNLALASVLRSPLFDCSDAELMQLALAAGAHDRTPWLERLRSIASRHANTSALAHAWRCLDRWRALANQLPVHDLLDRIYSESNVLERYDAAFPEHLRGRARANLTRFIELALEVDSGRYPSLSHFLDRLEQLREHGAGLDEAPVTSHDGCVRLMTVHGAKGLEAGVVFVADTASAGGRNDAWDALVDWPPDADRPVTFLLTGRQDTLDSVSQRCLAERRAAERREEGNLLYVALTRARQCLFISASAPRKKPTLTWYHLIAAGLAADDPATIEQGWRHAYGAWPAPAAAPVAPPAPATPVPIAWSQPLVTTAPYRDIAPSLAAGAGIVTTGVDEEARRRGVVLHRLLEWLAQHPKHHDEHPPRVLSDEFSGDVDTATLTAWWREARAVVTAPALAPLFDPARFEQAWNEVPIQYVQEGATVHGVIDRLVIDSDAVRVIDYKTQRDATPDTIARLAQPYAEQLRLYRAGVERLWPGRPVRALLVFTACATAVEINEETR